MKKPSFVGKSGLRKFIIIIFALIVVLILGIQGKINHSEWAIVSICGLAMGGYIGEYIGNRSNNHGGK